METDRESTSSCMRMLRAGVPLTLLWDLSERRPASAEILCEEPTDTGWIASWLQHVA